MAHIVDLEARRAQLLSEIDRATEDIRAIDTLMRRNGGRGDGVGAAVGLDGAPPGKRQRSIRGRALLRDVVLAILASVPGQRMQVTHIKSALRARGRVQADEDLRGVMKKLREGGQVEFFSRPGTLGYLYWACAGAADSSRRTLDDLMAASGIVAKPTTEGGSVPAGRCEREIERRDSVPPPL